ncbi:MAG: asparaginyl/glutamyl-tRNA amidotransferase subunit C [Nitrospirae bacterium GWF2_44_13]|nr:MAG: asparaginyl/glutamyl-tRNA amidotransferase subunit C [Nitrospirae bacterium GWF2_44_13]OGW65585.1 MAG: asparaginyl/glutamyl-tRNA amidotransferase subunit C [Nitrospirae bacterium RIFOXYA2_FULL_44_9]OGW73318.1 MAG: asparaginyl/glutamyl-tRNA amidotransferase subunit C [Nitrospirae bacterium RIFOXYC2_FULL_44_7]HBG93054.1 Asp-tRNA(Asn)/Glu-tRNA(Gln) amidotransferase subunit GatB [Nitrospiraceae bacterium]HBU05307.1 Asp-tRNA(Asn)/Glu-tRNA(Gln) amidotransferase subunit GatB [Nitrospiraceae ba
MKISVAYISKLARLSVSEKEAEAFSAQLQGILSYMEKLNELDTKDVEPTSHVVSLSNVMRDDIQRASISREDALANAPDRTDKFYRVPRIIE